MKKGTILAGALSMALLFSLDTMSVSAVETTGNKKQAATESVVVCEFCDTYCSFIDEDGDGICDHYVAGTCGGVCGQGYVDADGDGVCDNYASGACPGNGGAGYVDANGDGVCDNYASGACVGNAGQNGNGGGGRGGRGGNGGGRGCGGGGRGGCRR